MTEFLPKVFISYAWTSEEYTKKIYDFVRRLRNDGVETLFDQFDLNPGRNNYLVRVSMHQNWHLFNIDFAIG